MSTVETLGRGVDFSEPGFSPEIEPRVVETGVIAQNHRVLTAMITPFLSEEQVDYDGARMLAGYLEQHGSDGLILAGTTGESAALSVKE